MTAKPTLIIGERGTRGFEVPIEVLNLCNELQEFVSEREGVEFDLTLGTVIATKIRDNEAGDKWDVTVSYLMKASNASPTS